MRCDLHIHSCYSFDSLAKPKDIINTAVSHGLQCIAIADHGNMKGYFEAAKYSQLFPLLIIPAEEVKSKQGDILALNIKTPIPDKLSALETIGRIKQQNGTVIIPHPFGSLCRFKYDLKKILNLIDGIEILNASVFGAMAKRPILPKKMICLLLSDLTRILLISSLARFGLICRLIILLQLPLIMLFGQ